MPSGTGTRQVAPATGVRRSLTRVGPRKLAATAAYLVVLLGLWLVTGDPAVVALTAIVGAGIVLAAFLLVVRRRARRTRSAGTSASSSPAATRPVHRSVSPSLPPRPTGDEPPRGGPVVRSRTSDLRGREQELAALEAALGRTRRFPRMPPHAENLRIAEQLLGLDRAAAAAAGRPDVLPVSVERTPMAIGLGSLFLTRLHLTFPDGTSAELVEKGILRQESNEADFWLDPELDRRHLAGETFECLAPASVLTAGPISVLHLPYRPELDHSREEANENFRDHLDAITVAVAHLNVSNPVRSSRSPESHPFLPRWRRPTVREVDQLVDPGNENVARALVHLWREVRGGVDEVLERYAELPHYLCHHDIGAGNAIHVGGRTTFLDLAFVGAGPLGSDMHSVIRTSRALTDLDRVDGLLRRYTEAVQRLGVEVDPEDVELAAWTSYYLRYSSVRWRSARDPDAFSLALVKMAELIHG